MFDSNYITHKPDLEMQFKSNDNWNSFLPGAWYYYISPGCGATEALEAPTGD